MKKWFDKLGKKGFTLVELTVVLVIIGILAAIGIPTAMHFIKKAEYRKNEENAKTAYLAAESMLTWYRSSGEWEAFRNEVMANGVENNTFPAGDEREGRIYAVSVNHWDGVPSQSQEQAMKLLDGGVYSKDFFNAEIVIEIDVESGQVYSAFYGTRCDSLTYRENAGEGQRCISANGSWREPDIRKEVVLGYYSVEDVANVVELKQVRLKVTTINLINSETLSLNWTSNSRNDNLDVKYLITFYQKDDNGDKKLFTTEVELSKLSGQLKTVPSEDAGISTKTGMVNLEVKDPNEKDVSWGEWAFPLTYQQTGGSSGRIFPCIGRYDDGGTGRSGGSKQGNGNFRFGCDAKSQHKHYQAGSSSTGPEIAAGYLCGNIGAAGLQGNYRGRRHKHYDEHYRVQTEQSGAFQYRKYIICQSGHEDPDGGGRHGKNRAGSGNHQIPPSFQYPLL